MTVPTRGLCHGLFLLTFSATAKERRSVDDWVAGAAQLPTYAAFSVDLREAASTLLALGLASLTEGSVRVDNRLATCGPDASIATLARIARLVLSASPPAWLGLVADRQGVNPDLIPVMDADALRWLGEALGPIVLDAWISIGGSSTTRDRLGRIGEQVVVENERALGYTVEHVALVSDSFGFDVLSRAGSTTRRIEVKATTSNRAGCFFLSKNEAATATRFCQEWLLVQVVLHPRVVVNGGILSLGDVEGALVLDAPAVLSSLLHDTPHCRWVESVEVSIPADSWGQYQLLLGTGPRASQCLRPAGQPW